MHRDKFESNQSGIETSRVSVEALLVELFESNQSGIETFMRTIVFISQPRLNRTKVELKRVKKTAGAMDVAAGLNRTKVELKR